jgi:predicted thioredoxin/glutaredoxin
MRVTIYSAPGQRGDLYQQSAHQVLLTMGVEAEVRLKTSELDFICNGVMVTPALEIDGELICSGCVVEPDDLKHYMERHLSDQHLN